MRVTGWSELEKYARIMKHHYPEQGSVPRWARLAYDRHWITLAQLLAVPMEGTSRLVELLYEQNPLFALIKKAFPQPPSIYRDGGPVFSKFPVLQKR